MLYGWYQRFVQIEDMNRPDRGRPFTQLRDRLRRVLDDERLRRGALAGAFGGLVAGVVLSVVMMVLTYAHGQNVWGALKFAALPFVGSRALEPGFDALAIVSGILAHFAVSIAWGVMFGMLAFGLEASWKILAGGVFGLPVWAVMHGLVVPHLLAKPPRLEPLSIVLHVVFGLVLAAAVLAFDGEGLRWARRWGKQTA